MKQFEVVTSNGDITVVSADGFRFNHAGNNVELLTGSGAYADVVALFSVGHGFSIINKNNIVDEDAAIVDPAEDSDIPF